MCAAQSFKMRGFQSGPSLKIEGVLELRIRKKRIFLKGGSFGAAQVGNVELTSVYFWKGGSFGAVQVEKVESLGAAQAEKCGAFGRHIPVLP